MDMRNSFFVLFVMVLEKFSGKKFWTIPQESQKIAKFIIFVYAFSIHN
jgi:hypothetical protein